MGNSHSKTQLKTAVKERRWSDAFSLLADSSYCNSAVEHFIKYCDKYGLDSEFSLSEINTEERDALLKTAVRVRQWNVVHHVLKAGVSHGMRVWVLEQACKKDFQEYIMQYVDDLLTLCSTEQLDTLLTTATSNGQWNVVHKLCSGGSHSQRMQIIEHACKTADDCYLQVFIQEYVNDGFLSQCSTDQLNTLLTTATTQRMWYMVHKVLKADVSHEKRVWVIEQANSPHACYILLHAQDGLLDQCSTEQLDTLLTTATTSGWWHMVHKLLKVVDSHEKRVWIIEQACKTADYKDYKDYILPYVDSDFLSHCSTEQLDTLLTTATTRGLWSMVNKVLKVVDSHEKRVWVIEHAFKTANYKDYKDYILQYVDSEFLSHCSTEQLDTLLMTATTIGRWWVVKKLFLAGGSPSQRIHIIEHACKTVDFWNFQKCILEYVDDDVLSHCSTEQLGIWLTKATTRGLWSMVNKVLKVVDSHEKRKWVIEQACKTADYKDYKDYILPYVDSEFLSHCSTEQLNTLLTTATTRGLWHMVNKVLKVVDCHEKRVWVITKACKTATYSDFEEHILLHVDGDFLSHCSTEQLDSWLTTATTRRLWHMVHTLFNTGDSPEKRAWVIEEACKTADYMGFKECILPHVHHDFLAQCSLKHQNILLTTATTQRLWHMVDKVLKAGGGSHKKRVWVIETAGKTANYKDFKDYVLPHIDDDFLTTATTQGLWPVVQKVLTVSSSHKQKALIIEEACETAGYVDFRQYILQYVDSDFLSHCSAETIDTLLTTATMLGLWHLVHKVLNVVVSHEKRVWVIEEACETASYRDFRLYILQYVDSDFLSHCNADKLETLLTKATTGGLWHMVHKVLEVVGNHEKRVWVIEVACKTADNKDYKDYILPYVDHDFLSKCNTEQLDFFLTTATTRGLWHVVHKVLGSVDAHEKRVWVIEEACKTADNKDYKDYILPYVDHDFMSKCNTEQLDTLLTTATTRGLWHMVHKLFETVSSHEKRVWVIKQACHRAAYQEFEDYILQHVDSDFMSRCSTQELDTFFTTATTRGLWHMVHTLLETVDSHEKRVRVLVQACKTADYEDQKYILPYVDSDFLSQCSTENLDYFLTTATTRGLWHMVHKLLKADFSKEKCIWVVEQACKTADFSHIELFKLPQVNDDLLSFCSTEQLDTLLTTATKGGVWHVVDKVLKAGGSHRKRAWVIETAAKTANNLDFKDYVYHHIDDDFLTIATMQGLWPVVQKVLYVTSSHKKGELIIEEACETADYVDFRNYILPYVDHDFLSKCSTEQLDTLLTTATTRELWHMVHKLLETGVSHEERVWVIEQACKTANSKDFKDYILPHVDNDLLSHCSAEELKTLLSTRVFRGKMAKRRVIRALTEACKGFTYATVMIDINVVFGISNVQLLISSLPSKQLSCDAQSVAFRFALQERKWDVISRACLSKVWEQVRRHLFREAVYQRQWINVKKWADHTLYDDERWWALEETYKLKQWDVMLQLADHGLTEIELMRVRYRLAKHADWNVVLQMFERGVDVTEVREMVETVMLSRKAKADKENHCALVDRWWQLRQLEEKLIRASATRITLPSTASQWESVLFRLHRHPGTVSVRSRSQPSKTFGGLLLQRAIKQRAWYLVMHLVRLGLDTSQLDSLLTDMIRRRQWGVCRVLLEQGVSVQLCLHSLFVFMEMNQWMLVARVIEFIVDDSLKHQVEQLALDRSVGSLVWQCVSAMCSVGMCLGDALRLHVIQRAMERREGGVVGECINTMEHYRLSAKEREELFQKAISRGILQAVKPLVEHKDETGIQHRDTAMLAAIKQRQWDVVDCCQLQGADIDIKDEHGETSLIREVWNSEWKAVEELVVRGADPNVLDNIDNCSVLYKAIRAKQWDIVRLLIEYHADIHKAAPLKPLNMLIDERQGGIIHHTLIWCPDQAKGVNDKGETTLHAIALDESPGEHFYYQIVRGVNPLKLTKEGHSVLLYAVGNEPCPQKMVAECIRLGFSTHQPRLTQLKLVDLIEYVTDGLLNGWKMHGYYGMFPDRRITSPFLLAVLHGIPAVPHMLYESGSCSSTELQRLYTMLLDLLDPRTDDGRTLLEGERVYGLGSNAFNKYQEEYKAFVEYIATILPYLSKMASTPRSLVSTCRLVISHSITVRKKHERDVQDLFMSDRMKNYLLFSDLTDPDYQPSMYGTCHHTEFRNRKELEQWMKKTYDKILKDLEGADPSDAHLSATNESTQRDSV